MSRKGLAKWQRVSQSRVWLKPIAAGQLPSSIQLGGDHAGGDVQPLLRSEELHQTPGLKGYLAARSTQCRGQRRKRRRRRALQLLQVELLLLLLELV